MPETVIEEVPTIVKETHSQEDLINERVEREKKKLYATLESKEGKVREVEQKFTEALARVKELEEAEQKRQMEKLDVTERLQKQLEAAEKKLEKAQALAAEKDAELAKRQQQSELSKFKERVIKEAGIDPDFMDLVRGESKEDILESIEKAKNIQDKFIKQVPTEQPRTAPPTAPATNPPLNVELPDLKNIPSFFNNSGEKEQARKLLDDYKRKVGILR